MGDWCVFVVIIPLEKCVHPPALFSKVSARCSLLLKPLKEDSCSTFLHGKQPWNCFWHFFPVCNSMAHVFVADMWKCSFQHKLFCGMMYVLHIHKFGEGTLLLCFQTVEVTCDLLELSDKTLCIFLYLHSSLEYSELSC